uniref:SAM domain-containing protein n=1 Tax=Panagrolaimus superbus TaxID=310955 RepID=A0A914ZC77_9BILA
MAEGDIEENPDFDGNYTKAQRNCAIMIGQLPSTKASSNSLSSVYSDSSYLRKSGASTHLHRNIRRPTTLSASASGGVISSHLQPPASPSAHSLGEIGEKRYSRPTNIPMHLRSNSSSSQSNRYQYLNESTSSPRISPKRIQKLSNSDDFIQQKLKQIGLQRYSQAFRDQEVDITTFLKCDENDIRQIVNTVSSSNETDIAAIVDLIAELRQIYSSNRNLESNK